MVTAVFVIAFAYPYVAWRVFNCYPADIWPERVTEHIPGIKDVYGFVSRENTRVPEDGITRYFMADNQYFYNSEKGKLNKLLIKGVNMGAAKPGYFPGDLAITKEEYLRWFNYIEGMNANSIRVYTAMKPEFYQALYEHNRNSDKKLYLFQGVWMDENAVKDSKDACSESITASFKEEITNLVDIIHGNCTLPVKSGAAYGKYTADVSPYVAGWIVGIEWPPEFVEGTNKSHPDKTAFKGKFLYTDNASPFEVFLCEMGELAIDYEVSKYKLERPLSFTNWLTTDPLEHPDEPDAYEDMAAVDTGHIKSFNDYKGGLFASYHVYPYYPNFMNYQKDYLNNKDSEGRSNTYASYLKDIREHHDQPLLVSEFGIPASRGMAHEDINRGFNQGFIDEKAQGEMLVSMFEDIFDEGSAGGLAFSWQDEWFKRTWNTMDYDLPDRRPLWSNPQTNEQEFGLLAFDPGNIDSTCYVDGDTWDWEGRRQLIEKGDSKLFVKSDEKYVYMMIHAAGFDLNKDKIIIPIDSVESQGNSYLKQYNAKLDKSAEFVIIVDGKLNSRVLVDAYYDAFYYSYAVKEGVIERKSQYEKKDSGIFNTIELCLNKTMIFPQSKETVPFKSYETGKLLFGDANPAHESYNSLADFSVKDDVIELRIPWQLINVMDPSQRMVMQDIYKEGFKAFHVEGINVGMIIVKDGVVKLNADFQKYIWDEWKMPTYHERLKPSYQILKEYLAGVN